MFQNSIHCWIFPSRQTYFCLYPLTNFSHSDAYLNVYNTSVSADDSERYSYTLISWTLQATHWYFLDIMSYTLLFPWHLDEGCHDWSPAYLGWFPGYSQLYGCPESVSESVPTCQELWGTTHAMPSAMVLPP